MRVGALEETITVTGEASAVDVQNVTQQRVMTRDVMDAIPVGTKSVVALGVLIPGMTTNSQDVGGTQYGSAAMAIHGSRLFEQTLLYDGMYYNNGAGRGGSFVAVSINDATVREVSLETGSLSAESELGGVRQRDPEGWRQHLRGFFSGAFTNHRLQSTNLSDELQAQGLTSVDRVNYIYDVNPAVGGPIRADKVWFFGAYRQWETNQYTRRALLQQEHGPWIKEDDLRGRPIEGDEDYNGSIRLTWQASSAQQGQLQHQHARQIRDHFYTQSTTNRTQSPEATINYYADPSRLTQAGWNAPWTNSCCSKPAGRTRAKDFQFRLQTPDGVDRPDVPWRDLGTGLSWGNLSRRYGHNDTHQYEHAIRTLLRHRLARLKVGLTFQHAWALDDAGRRQQRRHAAAQERHAGPDHAVRDAARALRNHQGQHRGLRAGPVDDAAVHAQPRRPVRLPKLLRPGAERRPGPLVPNRNITSPRSRTCRTGRTCRRGSARLRPVRQRQDGGQGQHRPLSRRAELDDVHAPRQSGQRHRHPGHARRGTTPSIRSAIRAAATSRRTAIWCRRSPTASAAAANPSNFGTTNPTVRYSDEALDDARLQLGRHGRLPARAAAARLGECRLFPPLVRQLPVDRQPEPDACRLHAVLRDRAERFAAAGRRRLSGVRSLRRRTAIVAQNNVVTLSNNFGDQTEIYNGVDFSVDMRLPRGMVLQGGTSTGRVATNNCFVVDSPQQAASIATSRRRSRRRSSCSASTRCHGGASRRAPRSRACLDPRSPPGVPTRAPRSRRRSAAR